MSDDHSDDANPCEETNLTVSAVQVQEIAILKYWYALADPRPDPGIYHNADADGAARDIVELNILLAFEDPRALASPWAPYVDEEDLLEEQ